MQHPALALNCPRLRQDITFLETPDGLYVRGGGVNFTMAGRGVYRLLSALLPHLDGTTPLATLLDSVGEQERGVILRFLGALHSKGLLNEGALPPDLADDATLQALVAQRAFLSDLGAPADAIGRIADARVSVLGGTHAAAPVVRLLEGNGVGARRGGCERRDWEDALPEDALIVALATEDDAHRLTDLARRAEGTCDFLPVWQQGGRVLIGPWQGRADGAVARSAIARAAAAEGGTPYVTMALGTQTPQPTLGRATYEAIAALLSLEVFKILGGVDDGALRLSTLSMRTDTLQTVREPVTLEPAFFPGVDSLPVASVEHPEGPVAWDQEVLYRRYAALAGDPCGLFTRFDDDALRQLPIKVGLLRAPVHGGDIIGTDMEHVLGARLNALTAAAALHAVASLRHRPTDQDAPGGRVEPRRMSAWLGGEPLRERWARAHSTVSDLSVEVPFDAVAAGPQHRSPSCYEPDLHGVGVGPVWDMALESAAFSAWSHETARAVEAGTMALREVRVDAPGDADAAPVRLLLNSLSRPAGVRVLTPENSSPMAVVVAPGRDTAVWAHADRWVDAAIRALSFLVVQEQLGTLPDKESKLRLVAARMSGASLRFGAQIDNVAALACAGPSPWDALRDEGFEPLVVDITSPELREVVHVARVLLRVAERAVR